MKKIECYIQPYNLDAVAEALAVEGVVGMSVAEVKGFGVQKGFTRGEDVKAHEYRFHPKMKVEMEPTRMGFGRALKRIGKDERIFTLHADISGSIKIMDIAKPACRVPSTSRMRLSPTYAQRAGSIPILRAASQ